MFVLLVVLAFNANSMTAFSAPAPEHQTTQETLRWVPAPTTRGTFNLLSSCVLTLFLCLWSSLHLNVPHQDEKPLDRAARKLRYTLLALFAPELIVLMAWRQYVSAKILYKDVNKALELKGRSDRWTIVHGFYAGMGGFVMDINDPANSFVRNKHTRIRVALTAEGVALLAQCGYLPPPDISEQFIDDKSKADALAKFLVCVQGVWCLLQYVGRLASHLPVSLLELNTLGHALCALIIYIFWWSKPLDIRHPYVLSDDQVPPSSLCAYMWMCGRVSRGCFFGDDRRSECSFVEFSPQSQAGANSDHQSTYDQPVELREGEDLPGTSFHFNSEVFQPRSVGFPCWSRRETAKLETFLLHPEDVRRWRLANKAIIEYSEFIHIGEGK